MELSSIENESPKKKSKFNTKKIVCGLFIGILLILLIVAVIVYETHPRPKEFDVQYFNIPKTPSILGRYQNAAVVGGGAECTGYGTSILKEGGHAVDAAIATGLCLGVVIPYSLGISGGHFSLIYDRKNEKIMALNARETAPQASSRDMYLENPKSSKYGGKSAGVPGEIKGFWEAHQKFGKLPWKRLFVGAIERAREGFKVHDHFLLAMRSIKKHADLNSSAANLVFNEKTGEFRKLGELVKQPELADTLEAIANGGFQEFYGGQTGTKFVEDVKNLGGVLTVEDLRSYNVKWRDAVQVKYGDNLKLFTMPPPSSGILIPFIINIMDGYNISKESRSTFEKYMQNEHRLVEAQKFAFAHRSKLGDPDFVNIKQVWKDILSHEYADKIRRKITDAKSHEPEYYHLEFSNKEDHGTGHIAVVDKDGNAVSMTATLNTFFGSKNVSKSTGILIGNTMDDFSSPGLRNHFNLPPSESNFIAPNKRPQSSMSPCIFVDGNGDVKLVIGAAGGTKIISAVATVVLRNLWMERGLKEAIDEYRLHHQIIPDYILYEEGYSEEGLKVLKNKGHNLDPNRRRDAVVQAIGRDSDNYLLANSDHRKGGFQDGY